MLASIFARQEYLAIEAVQFRHLYRVRRLIAPVQVATEPVDSDAVRVTQRRTVQHLVARRKYRFH